MRNILCFVLFAIYLLIPTASFAVLELSGRVVDEYGAFSEDESNALIRASEEHEAKTTNQVVVVTVNSLEGKSIEAFTLELANSWGIGQKDKNNGVVLLVAPKQREVRIEVGKGLENVLTNDNAQLIIDKIMIPQFKQGRYSEGAIKGFHAIIDHLEGRPIKKEWYDVFTNMGDNLIALLLLPIFFIGRLFGFFKGNGGSKGGGSFSGGGGSFSGGGASGKW